MVVGEATGFGQVVQLKSVEGLHVNVFPPFTLSVVEVPIHIDGLAAVTVGGPGVVIEIVTVAVPEMQVPDAITV